eukprot:6199202-Pleurochrysis_carterae.AAC.3
MKRKAHCFRNCRGVAPNRPGEKAMRCCVSGAIFLDDLQGSNSTSNVQKRRLGASAEFKSRDNSSSRGATMTAHLVPPIVDRDPDRKLLRSRILRATQSTQAHKS